jgi:hypothetical protein
VRDDLLHARCELIPLAVQLDEVLRRGHGTQGADEFLLHKFAHSNRVGVLPAQRSRGLQDVFLIRLHLDEKLGAEVDAQIVLGDQRVRPDGEDVVAAIANHFRPAHARADEGHVRRAFAVELGDDREHEADDEQEQAHDAEHDLGRAVEHVVGQRPRADRESGADDKHSDEQHGEVLSGFSKSRFGVKFVCPTVGCRLRVADGLRSLRW